MTDSKMDRMWRMYAAGAVLVACLLGLPAGGAVFGQAPAAEEGDDDARTEYKAKTMLDRGLELLESGQTERGVKLLQSVPQMYPKSKARFKAHLVLGKQHLKENNFPLAIRALRNVEESEDPEEQAEALYQLGICYFMLDRLDNAFMSFRKVTNDYPWSVYANEAYYYIGQCHFKLGRWTKAIEALEMVGTSVPPNQKSMTYAEAGQRLYVKVFDKDFVVLAAKGEAIQVALRAATGDEEVITLEPLGRSGEHYIGSIRTELGAPKKGDGILQFVGADQVEVVFTDRNTQDGQIDQRILATIQLVGTAALGFTDGAYKEYTKGVYGDKDCFLRVKDLDRDRTDQPDRIRVKLHTEYTVRQFADGQAPQNVDLEAPREEIRRRDELEIDLVETGPHTGVFVGKIVTAIVTDESAINTGDDMLASLQGDDIVVTYVDEQHMMGRDPRQISAKAKLLIGQIQDVVIEQNVVERLRDKARKNLIEGKIYLKLGQIFREVGLKSKAFEKAAEGLDRIDEVISVHIKASLDRDVVEEAFSVKWDLLLVQDKLTEAIGICRTLMQLFPDSSLVDQALFKIAVAKKEAGETEEAMRIFTEVTRLQNSDLAAEAQYNIGALLEAAAAKMETEQQKTQQLGKALLAYRKCAESWPDSPFAGEALEWIAKYYIETKDYARAVELMERVFQDYQDAAFLPKMLLQWIAAAYRMGDYAMAKDKAEQLMSQYPQMAAQAKKYLDVIDARLGTSGGGE